MKPNEPVIPLINIRSVILLKVIKERESLHIEEQKRDANLSHVKTATNEMSKWEKEFLKLLYPVSIACPSELPVT